MLRRADIEPLVAERVAYVRPDDGVGIGRLRPRLDGCRAHRGQPRSGRGCAGHWRACSPLLRPICCARTPSHRICWRRFMERVQAIDSPEAAKVRRRVTITDSLEEPEP